jgi:hypothetical protein
MLNTGLVTVSVGSDHSVGLPARETLADPMAERRRRPLGDDRVEPEHDPGGGRQRHSATGIGQAARRDKEGGSRHSSERDDDDPPGRRRRRLPRRRIGHHKSYGQPDDGCRRA